MVAEATRCPRSVACKSVRHRRAPRPAAVSRPSGGRARPERRPLALAREVGARDPALHRARVPLAHAARADRDRVLRDPLHGPLPARDLRLQPRGHALDVAGRLLLVRGARHGPLPALHARRRSRLPGAVPHRVSRAAVARARAREVVAARDPAVPHRRDPPRRRGLRGRARGRLRRRLGCRVPDRPDRRARLLRRGRAALHLPLPAAASSTSSSGSTAGSRASPHTSSSCGTSTRRSGSTREAWTPPPQLPTSPRRSSIPSRRSRRRPRPRSWTRAAEPRARSF